MIAILLTLLFLIVYVVLYSVAMILDEEFSKDWVDLDELSDREGLEMENTEYDWGHNIKNYMEE